MECASFTYANTTSITNQSLMKAAVVLPKCLIHLSLNWLVFSAQLSGSTLPSHAGLYQLPLLIPITPIPMRLQAYLPLFQCNYPSHTPLFPIPSLTSSAEPGMPKDCLKRYAVQKNSSTEVRCSSAASDEREEATSFSSSTEVGR